MSINLFKNDQKNMDNFNREDVSELSISNKINNEVLIALQ